MARLAINAAQDVCCGIGESQSWGACSRIVVSRNGAVVFTCTMLDVGTLAGQCSVTDY